MRLAVARRRSSLLSGAVVPVICTCCGRAADGADAAAAGWRVRQVSARAAPSWRPATSGPAITGQGGGRGRAGAWWAQIVLPCLRARTTSACTCNVSGAQLRPASSLASAAADNLPWGRAAGAPPQPGQSDARRTCAFSQTGREERANAASHALGCVLALFAVPALAAAGGRGPAPAAPGRACCVFVASMVLMYLRVGRLPRRPGGRRPSAGCASATTR